MDKIKTILENLSDLELTTLINEIPKWKTSEKIKLLLE